MNRLSENRTNSVTRRSILKLPLLCWLTSMFSNGTATSAFAAEPPFAGGTMARRATSLSGAWSLTYGPVAEYPQSRRALLPRQSGPPFLPRSQAT